MLGNIFTLDYEIHGNGEGSPKDLMIKPTDIILNLFEQYGARLTIMADVAEIIKFKEYKEDTGNDKFYYDEIVNQLRKAIAKGHDVQLHIHSSYFKSRYQNGMWSQNWSEYSMADLPYERLNEIIGDCKLFLEDILLQTSPDYKCFVFRAANWSMRPSHNIVRALIENDIRYDTSVFKYGKRDEIVKFDYSEAHSDLIPWLVDQSDIRLKDPHGKLVEIPIYCENKSIWSFMSLNRMYRILQAIQHQHPETKEGYHPVKHPSNSKSNTSVFNKIRALLVQKHPRKMDFNQCTAHQLIKTLRNIHQNYDHGQVNIPVVLIGHSKIFTKMNAKVLEPFLRFVAANDEEYCFARFGDYGFKELAALSDWNES